MYQDSLKNTKFDEKFSNWEPKFLKKLRVKNPSETDILNLINTNDIKIEESYIFHKKQLPENLKNISNLNFDLLVNNNNKKSNKNSHAKKFIFILNEDSDFNRNVIVKAEKIAKLNPENKYFIMYNSDSNKIFLKERFGIEFRTYPQLIKLDDIESMQKAIVFPMNDLLSYRIDLPTLNDKVSNFI